MSTLFETTYINGLPIKNRFIRSATWEGMADIDGFNTEQLTELFQNYALNGVGLIIPGHAYVSQTGKARPRQLGVHTDQHIAGLKTLTQAVHEKGGKIALQISHAGCYTSSDITGSEVFGPSCCEGENGIYCKEMRHEDIRNVGDNFAMSALRAKISGFDAVQIHAAHGYLLSEFLSPFFNRRTDAYGGKLENRVRILLDVVRKVRDAVGLSYPILIKLNSEDFLSDGFTQEEMLQVAAMLEDAGINAIELSGGTRDSGRNVPTRAASANNADDEIYYRNAAKNFKNKIKIPLMLVGGIRSFAVAEDLAKTGLADFISLSRPLIREPDLVKRWMAGDARKATCISCSQCFKPALNGDGISCVVEDALKKKL